MRPWTALAAAAVLAAAGTGPAAGETLGRFAAGDLAGWEVRVFEGETSYRIGDAGGGAALRAESAGTASSLYLEREIDLRATPVLAWRWRVDGVLAVPDERVKKGDDFAARLYVVAPGEGIFGRPDAVCYVWANRAERGESWPNPFTGHVRVLAVDSGAGDAGAWREHRRDVAADFRRLFGRKVEKLEGVAVMTDSDNSGLAASAWYGDIAFVGGAP